MKVKQNNFDEKHLVFYRRDLYVEKQNYGTSEGQSSKTRSCNPGPSNVPLHPFVSVLFLYSQNLF